jgi:hypothetical protein
MALLLALLTGKTVAAKNKETNFQRVRHSRRHVSNESNQARAPSIPRSTCQHSFGQAFTRDQTLAFAKSVVKSMGTESKIIEWKKHEAH